MRTSVFAIRTALAGAAVAVVLSGCSGNGDTTTSAPTTAATTAPTSAAAPTTASSTSTSAMTSATSAGGSADTAAFCSQAQGLLAQVQSSVATGLANPQGLASLGQTLQQTAGKLAALQPPAAIASDWNTFTSTLQQVAQQVAKVNPSDPNALSGLQSSLAQDAQQLTTSGQRIQSYVSSQCGSATASGTASATS